VFLTWLYCSAFVLLLGAEFNAAARRRAKSSESGTGGQEAGSQPPSRGGEA
jgi:uncharacterized BrkB/YihY/UPF0761 family membrane protein